MTTVCVAHISLTVAALAFLEIAAVGVAHGTPPEAWAAHEKVVVSACAAASNSREAKPGGSLVDFDDRVGFTAVVDGRYPQPQMNNKRGRVLWLFDKRTRTPFVSNADSMLRKREP